MGILSQYARHLAFSGGPAPFRLPSTSPVSPLATALMQRLQGKEGVIIDFLTAVLAGGSVLLEDLPGVGKTTLAKTFAMLTNLKFSRLQCTPDLLPADVFGFSVYNAQSGSFTFRPGPVFCNVLLVDEINRASPRTQSSLLEAMAERQVTIEGVSHELAKPFIVLATQNPVGFQGTYPLPEAQLDRFLMHLKLDYPDADSELEMLMGSNQSSDSLSAILTEEELSAMQSTVSKVNVHRDLAEYIVQIVNATRTSERVQLGCSPRGTQMLYRAAQARSFIEGRAHVIPDDIQHVAPLVLGHRIVARRATREEHRYHASKRELIVELMSTIPVPV